MNLGLLFHRFSAKGQVVPTPGGSPYELQTTFLLLKNYWLAHGVARPSEGPG
jgi:hypothetical protein